jgi:hypothetical protein
VTVVATGIGRGTRVRKPLFSSPATSTVPRISSDEDDMDVPSFLRN